MTGKQFGFSFDIVRCSGLEPACVRTCPTKALGFGTMEELSKEKAKKASHTIASSARPSMVIILP